MVIKNIGFDSVEWLSEHKKLLRVCRSKEDYIPIEVRDSYFTFTYNDWVVLTQDTGEFLGSPHIMQATKGYDVEVESIDEDFPAEILERLDTYRRIEDHDKQLFGE